MAASMRCKCQAVPTPQEVQPATPVMQIRFRWTMFCCVGCLLFQAVVCCCKTVEERYDQSGTNGEASGDAFEGQSDAGGCLRVLKPEGRMLLLSSFKMDKAVMTEKLRPLLKKKHIAYRQYEKGAFTCIETE